MRLTKSLGFAGALIAAALVGGTLIGSALAADEETDDNTGTRPSTAGYCEIFLDTLAADLGVTRESLTAAGQSAAVAAIDAAVEAGDLTEQRAEAFRERIATADGSGCAWFGHSLGRGFHHGMERGVARGFVGGTVMEVAADALGIERAELMGGLRDAGSLEAVAEAQGVSYDAVKAAILAAVETDLDAAAQEGLSQERADAALERISAWLDDGGAVGGMAPGRDRWHQHGPGFGPGWESGDDGDA